METLKKFGKICGVTGLFAISALFYLPQFSSSAFASCGCESVNGAKTVESAAPQPAQGEPAGREEGQKFADITSEVRLGHEDWEKMQRAVYETVERNLVGRKFVEVYGPLGTGVQCVPLDTY